MAPDDIKIGQWVAVVKCLDPAADNRPLCGLPLKVKAVALPFVAVQTPDGAIDSIDTRYWALGKINVHYVKTMVGYKRPAPEPEPETGPRCVRCGALMRAQRHDKGVWKHYCDNCGSIGDPVDAAT